MMRAGPVRPPAECAIAWHPAPRAVPGVRTESPDAGAEAVSGGPHAAAQRAARAWHGAAMRWFRHAGKAPPRPEVNPDADTPRLAQLKQKPETWVLLSRKARVWQDLPGGPSYRPHLVLVLNGASRAILKSNLLDAAPETDDLEAVLKQAMLRPVPFTGGPRRPTEVQMDDAEQVAALTSRLAPLGVRCKYAACPPRIEGVRAKLERQMIGEPPIPGLLSVRGATEPRIRRLFELAAAYHAQAPWRFLSDFHPLEIRCPAASEPRYAIVMGSGREVYGLSVYDNAQDLATVFATGSRAAMKMSWLVLIFEEPRAISCYDLDDQERHGWPVAGPQAFPLVGRATRRGQLVVPNPEDLAWLDGALAALVVHFTGARSTRGLYPVHREITVTTLDGPRDVMIGTPQDSGRWHTDER